MNEFSNITETPEITPLVPRRKPYAQPILIHYGNVAALTQNHSCAGSNDSTDTLACDPLSMRSMDASDRRLKTDLLRIDTHPLGFGLYLFNYKPEHRARWGHGRQFGVMADEVERLVPDAVGLHRDGYKVVDYALLGIRRNRH